MKEISDELHRWLLDFLEQKGPSARIEALRAALDVPEAMSAIDFANLMLALAGAWAMGHMVFETHSEHEMKEILERHGFWPLTIDEVANKRASVAVGHPVDSAKGQDAGKVDETPIGWTWEYMGDRHFSDKRPHWIGEKNVPDVSPVYLTAYGPPASGGVDLSKVASWVDKCPECDGMGAMVDGSPCPFCHGNGETALQTLFRSSVVSALLEVGERLARDAGWRKGYDTDPPEITAYEWNEISLISAKKIFEGLSGALTSYRALLQDTAKEQS